MDVTFETQKGHSFCIEVGFFDTVLEIKEKIQKYHKIAVNRQTLVFNGKQLQDDHDVGLCEILHNSRIQLMLTPEPETANKIKVKVKTEPQQQSLLDKKTINLNIRIPSTKILFPLEMDINDSVLRLKERIHGRESVPVNRIILQARGTELQDNRSLRECELEDNAEIDVNIRSSPTASSGTVAVAVGPTAGATKKLKVMVLTKCGNKKIPVEVNASDNVGELRKELQKLHQRMNFHLPQEGYFFIYKQNVMDDDHSFRWHQVAQGDTIEIFNGSVTGGS
ncbi:hypothetical protein ACFE04_020171 [Oxalis oulophora]